MEVSVHVHTCTCRLMQSLQFAFYNGCSLALLIEHVCTVVVISADVDVVIRDITVWPVSRENYYMYLIVSPCEGSTCTCR